jgi:hypothetical protein
VTAVPSKKSSIQPGDRVLEINGVSHTDFKTEKKANDLFDMLILDIVPNEDEEEEEEEEEEESDDDDLD